MSNALYKVEFANGSTEAYTANIIAENIWSQVDVNGQNVPALDEILDHKHTAVVCPSFGDHVLLKNHIIILHGPIVHLSCLSAYNIKMLQPFKQKMSTSMALIAYNILML